jgi:hypothetical protein
MKTLLFGHSLVVLLSKRRRSLTGGPLSGSEGSSGHRDPADNHPGHGSGRWGQVEIRHRAKGLECGQSGNS